MSNDLPSIEDLLQKTGAKNTTTATTMASEATTDKASVKLEEIKIKEKEDSIKRTAESKGISYVNLVGFAISPDALILIPKEQAEQQKVICFLFSGSEIRVGAVDPENETAKELAYQLGERHHANADVYQISDHSFQAAFKLYDKLPKIRKIVKGVQITSEELEKYQKEIQNFDDLKKIIAEISITDMVSLILAASLSLGTSDVHIEAEEKGIVVRFRVDGILQEVATIPKEAWKQIISRLKLISGVKINITDKPQDGRFTIFIKEDKIDVRVSTLPTAFGESVVMRLLKPSSISLEFEQLGIRPLAFKRLETEINKPNGMIITTGPTGSGKTTTLYAVLRRLNKTAVKIITLEDPIEYKLEGINQSQIDHTKEYTFAKGLRSILRQDPDIVMVGEIRDLETAEIAVQAALTGHLMLSTIHTNDAAGAIPRFLSMGVKPFLLAPALRAIIGQRLVRKLCEKCKQEITLESEILEKATKLINSIPESSGEKVDLTSAKFYGPVGCEECNDSGYKGRIGIYEILLVNDELEKSILEGKTSEYEMREIAANQGMVTMVQDGLIKASEGQTSVEEVFRVAM